MANDEWRMANLLDHVKTMGQRGMMRLSFGFGSEYCHVLPVAVAAMPTVPVPVAEPGAGQSQSQAEEAEIRSGGGGENTNWAWGFGGGASPAGSPGNKAQACNGGNHRICLAVRFCILCDCMLM